MTIATVLLLSGLLSGIGAVLPGWAYSLERLPNSSWKQSSDATLPDLGPTGRPNDTVGGASHAVPDFRGTGRSGNHGGGASRGGCPTPETGIPLTLLTPVDANSGGFTTQANPMLWAYVPFALDENSPITFSLLATNNISVYEVFQVVNHEPGILKLDLPGHVMLEVGQVYEWYLIIHCDDPLGTREATFARGWIERVVDPLLTETGETPLVGIELSDAYASRLIWYDALTILGEQLLKTPNDTQFLNAWIDLLSLPSVQLEAVSMAPLRDCCTLQDGLTE